MSAEDTMSQIASAREAFRAAIEPLADRWEEAGLEPEEDPDKPWANARCGEAWSPRQVAEHVLSGDEMGENAFRTPLGDSIEQPEVDPTQGRERPRSTLRSAQAALDYIDQRTERMTALIDWHQLGHRFGDSNQAGSARSARLCFDARPRAGRCTDRGRGGIGC